MTDEICCGSSFGTLVRLGVLSSRQRRRCYNALRILRPGRQIPDEIFTLQRINDAMLHRVFIRPDFHFAPIFQSA